MRINWDKPKKARSTSAHNQMNSSDSGVAGTYVPNMSDEDRHSWKGKLVIAAAIRALVPEQEER